MAAKRHFSELRFFCSYVRVFPSGEAGNYHCANVQLEAYTPEAKTLMHAFESFRCDKDGYMSQSVYKQALAFGLGLTESVRSFQEHGKRIGIEIIDRYDAEKIWNREKRA